MINKRLPRLFITGAGSAAIFAGVLTTGASLLSVYGFNVWSLLDAAAFFGLAYGVFRKSRTCAIILFAYYLTDRVEMWRETHDVVKAFGWLPIMIAVIYFLGVLGTFINRAIQDRPSLEQ